MGEGPEEKKWNDLCLVDFNERYLSKIWCSGTEPKSMQLQSKFANQTAMPALSLLEIFGYYSKFNVFYVILSL